MYVYIHVYICLYPKREYGNPGGVSTKWTRARPTVRYTIMEPYCDTIGHSYTPFSINIYI